MRRTFINMMAVGMMLALATPALAGFKLNGYYRLTGVSQNIKNKSDDPATESLIDHRLRLKVTNQLNEHLSVVYYGEVDTIFGEQSKGKIGGGGQLGTDGVNVETKNAYVDFKIPDTAAAVRLGLQGFSDTFQGIVIDEDAAGATLTGQIGRTGYELFYSKFDEGDSRSEWDDRDFYGLNLSQRYNDFLKLGAAIYFEDDNAVDGADARENELLWYGLLADYRFGDFGLSGFVVLQDGELRDRANGVTIDSSALAASLQGAMVVPHGDVQLRLIYFSPDDDARDNGSWQGNIGEWEFPRENLMIFLPDRWVNNSGTTRYAIADAVVEGFGLSALTLSANLRDLPMGIYSNLGAGAFWAASDERNDTDASLTSGALIGGDDDLRAGDTLGYEVAASIGKVFADKFDLSLRGAYAFFGDFYDDTVQTGSGGVSSPDDVYKVALMTNVKF